ncbi:Uncharacterised protein [Nocardia asteroides]|nr:hypothetical protein SAMN05444423_1011264 [Nocardia asteroides]VEG38166.1 Uncharacterised protein [Nocardia asteroides]
MPAVRPQAPVMTERPFIATLFVTGPIAMVIWSEAAVLHGRGPGPRELLG